MQEPPASLKKFLFILAGVACCVVLLFRAPQATSQAPLPDPAIVRLQDVAPTGARGSLNAPFHPSRVLVRFRGTARTFLPASGSPFAINGIPNLFLVPNPAGRSVDSVLQQYRADANVLYAEPDYELTAFATPNDPLYPQQWDMMKISAPAAWNTLTNSSDVVVAVIDSGIDFNHPDLAGNLWTDPANGSHGFTCIGGGGCVPGGEDEFGHGTHVAGTIGGVGNNGVGIAGINWKVTVLSLKFLGPSGSGATSDAVNAFMKAVSLKQQGVNIRITNNSWGGGGFSQALKDAIAQAESAGIIHVCSAGNAAVNTDGTPSYPASYDNRGIVSVLASDSNDAGASFTNYGLASVDIAAPGVNTLSTVRSASCAGNQICDPSGYKLLSGTSMAAPHVAGVLAAVFHQNPALTPAQARDLILSPASYDNVAEARASTSSTGGRLNFAKVLSNPLLNAPVLNGFPSVTAGPNVFSAAGGLIALSASGSDPDGDVLRLGWAPASGPWLIGRFLNTAFPQSLQGIFSFTAPSFNRAATTTYYAAAADRRGGSASSRTYVTVAATPTPGLAPSGSLSLSSMDIAVGTAVTVNFPVTDPNGGSTAWELIVGNYYGYWTCCFTGSSVSVTPSVAGVYRISAQAMDPQLNLSTRQSAVLRVGGATGTPPIASYSLNKLSGPVPLTVTVNMSSSSDPDGTIQTYFIGCGNGTFMIGASSTGNCIYTTPGPYWLQLYVADNSGNYDFHSAYVIANALEESGVKRRGQITSN